MPSQPGITPTCDTGRKYFFWLVANRVGGLSRDSILPLHLLGVATNFEHMEDLPAHPGIKTGGLISHSVDRDVIEHPFLVWLASTIFK